MTLLREWPLLELVLISVLATSAPVEGLVVWNLGELNDALALALAHLHRQRGPKPVDLRVFHSGLPCHGPIEWSRSELRGTPWSEWLEPVDTSQGRWRPSRPVLERVLLGTPPGPVDVLIAGEGIVPSTRPLPFELIREGGYLLWTTPGCAPPMPEHHFRATADGRLYRKLTPARPGKVFRQAGHPQASSLARHQDQAMLVDSHVGFARALARRFVHRGELTEDLDQVAYLALIKAARRYDPGQGCAFRTFAASTILGELKRHFRDKLWVVRVPRSVQETHLALRAARDELGHIHKRSPTIPELAAYLETTEEAVLAAMEAAYNAAPTSLDMPSPDGQSSMTDVPTTDSGFDKALDRQVLEDSIATLSPTERLVLKRVFFDERTQRNVARELGISQMQVSRIRTRALAKIRSWPK